MSYASISDVWRAEFERRPRCIEPFAGRSLTRAEAVALVRGRSVRGMRLYESDRMAQASIDHRTLPYILMHLRLRQQLLWNLKTEQDTNQRGMLLRPRDDGPALAAFYARWGDLAPPHTYRRAWNRLVLENPSSPLWVHAYRALAGPSDKGGFSVAAMPVRMLLGSWREQLGHYLLRESTTLGASTGRVLGAQEDPDGRALQIELGHGQARLLGPDLSRHEVLAKHLVRRRRSLRLILDLGPAERAAELRIGSEPPNHDDEPWVAVRIAPDGIQITAASELVEGGAEALLPRVVLFISAERTFERQVFDLNYIFYAHEGADARRAVFVKRHAVSRDRYLVVLFDVQRRSGRLYDGLPAAGPLYRCRAGHLRLKVHGLMGSEVLQIDGVRHGSDDGVPREAFFTLPPVPPARRVPDATPGQAGDQLDADAPLELLLTAFGSASVPSVFLGFDLDAAASAGAGDPAPDAAVLDPQDVLVGECALNRIVLLVTSMGVPTARFGFRVVRRGSETLLLAAPGRVEALDDWHFPVRFENE